MSKIATPTVNTKKLHVKAVLKEAELYQNSNSLQRRDAKEALDEFAPRIQWKDGARVLDVGCGDGGVTVNVLKPHLPSNFEALVGCDIAPEMIMHANFHHKGERINFKVLDISSSATDDINGRFDHVFSFYALHWIQEQQIAINNIHSALVPGGDCLLVFLAHIPIYDIYRTLAKDPIWAEYMYDLEKYISPYHDSQNPEEEFRSLLEKSGFKSVEVSCKEKIYKYEGVDVLKRALRAVNPFNHRLSPSLRERFLEDYLEIIRKRKLINEEPGTDGSRVTIINRYSLLVAYAVK